MENEGNLDTETNKQQQQLNKISWKKLFLRKTLKQETYLHDDPSQVPERGSSTVHRAVIDWKTRIFGKTDLTEDLQNKTTKNYNIY